MSLQVASYLDPRYRLYCDKPEDTIAKITSDIEARAQQPQEDDASDEHSPEASPVKPICVNAKRPKLAARTPSAFTDQFLQRVRLNRTRPMVSTTPLTLSGQLECYALATLEEDDLVGFWLRQSHAWPMLAQYALRVLSIQATEVACERLFSWATATFTKGRSMMGHDRLAELLTIYGNLRDDDAST